MPLSASYVDVGDLDRYGGGGARVGVVVIMEFMTLVVEMELCKDCIASSYVVVKKEVTSMRMLCETMSCYMVMKVHHPS